MIYINLVARGPAARVGHGAWTMVMQLRVLRGFLAASGTIPGNGV